jgi:hypothetical protein
VVGQRRGQDFLDFFGETMTGVRPKSAFLHPLLALEVCAELARQLLLQLAGARPPLVPQDIGVQVVRQQQLQRERSK